MITQRIMRKRVSGLRSRPEEILGSDLRLDHGRILVALDAVHRDQRQANREAVAPPCVPADPRRWSVPLRPPHRQGWRSTASHRPARTPQNANRLVKTQTVCHHPHITSQALHSPKTPPPRNLFAYLRGGSGSGAVRIVEVRCSTLRAAPSSRVRSTNSFRSTSVPTFFPLIFSAQIRRTCALSCRQYSHGYRPEFRFRSDSLRRRDR